MVTMGIINSIGFYCHYYCLLSYGSQVLTLVVYFAVYSYQQYIPLFSKLKNIFIPFRQNPQDNILSANNRFHFPFLSTLGKRINLSLFNQLVNPNQRLWKITSNQAIYLLGYLIFPCFFFLLGFPS